MSRTTKTVLAVLSVAITLGVVWYLNRPVTLPDVTHEDVVAEAG